MGTSALTRLFTRKRKPRRGRAARLVFVPAALQQSVRASVPPWPAPDNAVH
jgi:hypothetical protein